MAGWKLSDIPWHHFAPSRADQRTIALAKAACLVEYNGGEYARYLSEVFAGDEALIAAAETWGVEEQQHGQALRLWCGLADPQWDFATAFSRFSARIRLPQHATTSVRGSKTGELVARCAVECGTSFYYSCLRDAVEEPVLKDICARISSDEFRHYRMFHDFGRVWQAREGLGRVRKLFTLLGRLGEGEDDELAYAWHCANGDADGEYRRRHDQGLWLRMSAPMLRDDHLERCVAMLARAAGWSDGEAGIGWLGSVLATTIRMRIRWLAAA